jgi:hypothetical protein
MLSSHGGFQTSWGFLSTAQTSQLLLVPSPQLITSASTESGIRVKKRKMKVLDYFVLDDLVFLFSFLLSFRHSSVRSEPDITSTLSKV